MSDNTSPALDDQPLDVRELRETVIREALSLVIHELKRFSDREYHRPVSH